MTYDKNMKDTNYNVDKELPINIVEEPAAAWESPIGSISEMINFSRNGINMNYLNKLSNKLSLSLQEMGEILHVSLRTLQRYAPTKVLDTDASAKAINLAALQVHGIDVFGSEKDFNEWLRSEVPHLGNKTPLSYLDTPFGFTLIDQTLGRIEHGLFA